MKIKKIISVALATAMVLGSLPMMSVQAAGENVNNIVFYTPVAAGELQAEPAEGNLIGNSSMDVYIEGEKRNYAPWWENDGMAFTDEDSVTKTYSDETKREESCCLIADMSKIAADSITIAGQGGVYIDEFTEDQSLKMTAYVKCIGDSAADELSTFNIYAFTGGESDNRKDISFTDPTAGYSHQTEGIKDGWVKIECYVPRSSVPEVGVSYDFHILVTKGPDRAADNKYLFDCVSLTVVNNSEIPKKSMTEPTIGGKITSSTTTISGNHGIDGSTLTLKSSKGVLATTTSIAQTYELKMKAQAPGTKLSIVCSKTGYDTFTKTITVGMAKPSIKKITKKSKKVTGKAYKNSTISVYLGKKLIGSGKASKSGSYTIKKFKKGFKKFKKGNTVKVKATYKKQSATATIKVK